MKIVKTKGDDMDATLKPYTTNLALASLFSDVSLTLNETLVEGGHHLYPYKAMMASLLQFDEGVKKTQLASAGYQEDKTERTKWFANSKSVEFTGALCLDFLGQSKYLLPGVDVRVKMNRSKKTFFLMTDGTDPQKGVKHVIEEAVLYVRRVKVAPSVLAGHELGLSASNAIYPIQQSELLSYTIPQGSKSHIQDNLFRGVIPKLLFVGMVKNEAVNGNMQKDPFAFEHFTINSLSLYREGDSIPYSQPLQMDFENGFFVQAYMQMIQALEMFNSNQTNGITMEQFKEGKTLFAFNLTPDLSASGVCGQPYRTGNLRMEIKFTKTLTEAINVIVFAIRDGKIEITKDRRIIKSS
jgi:hypothetical protein